MVLLDFAPSVRIPAGLAGSSVVDRGSRNYPTHFWEEEEARSQMTTAEVVVNPMNNSNGRIGSVCGRDRSNQTGTRRGFVIDPVERGLKRNALMMQFWRR
jgi:hypothetical protein